MFPLEHKSLARVDTVFTRLWAQSREGEVDTKQGVWEGGGGEETVHKVHADSVEKNTETKIVCATRTFRRGSDAGAFFGENIS